jgi:hypothetical protein
MISAAFTGTEQYRINARIIGLLRPDAGFDLLL